MPKPAIHHIPVCPFSQRVEILLELKGVRDRVDFHVVDITRPRPQWLLDLGRGTTALPIMTTAEGKVIKESLVILRYFEDLFRERPVAREDAYEHAVETMLILKEGPFTNAGYRLVMNQDPGKRQAMHEELLRLYADLDGFLQEHSPEGIFLFDEFGLAEAVFTPLFMRFWFLDYYETFELPGDGRFERVRRWRDACLAHPVAQQVSREEIVKSYYDYAKGAGNGALLPGRSRSSFVFEPDWRVRPWPPADKYATSATDKELGLV